METSLCNAAYRDGCAFRDVSLSLSLSPSLYLLILSLSLSLSPLSPSPLSLQVYMRYYPEDINNTVFCSATQHSIPLPFKQLYNAEEYRVLALGNHTH